MAAFCSPLFQLIVIDNFSLYSIYQETFQDEDALLIRSSLPELQNTYFLRKGSYSCQKQYSIWMDGDHFYVKDCTHNITV